MTQSGSTASLSDERFYCLLAEFSIKRIEIYIMQPNNPKTANGRQIDIDVKVRAVLI